jgi:hypothetical protein
MKCTDPSPSWVPVTALAGVCVDGVKLVVNWKGPPEAGAVKMNSHACCPSGTVRPRFSELAHFPPVVPLLPFQVTVPVEVSAFAAILEPSKAIVKAVVVAIPAASVITPAMIRYLGVDLPLI